MDATTLATSSSHTALVLPFSKPPTHATTLLPPRRLSLSHSILHARPLSLSPPRRLRLRLLSRAVDSPATQKIEPELEGGGGGSTGGGSGGGGGGGGGDRGDEAEGEEEENKKNKMMSGGMSMSQKLTLGYAALVGAGGALGYLKSGSQKSLIAGGSSALILYFVYTQLPVRPVFASSVGLGISAALLAVMGSRFKRSGKVFPAGVVSLVSLVMTGGYFHGILRSAH